MEKENRETKEQCMARQKEHEKYTANYSRPPNNK